MSIKGWITPTATASTKSASLDVSFAFGSAPFATTCTNFADRTWVDCSTMVRYVHIQRGRSHDLDVFGPDTAEIVLDNRTRYCDPACTTNAQAGKVIPGTPVRVKVKRPGSANFDVLYSGYVEGWSMEYPGMRDATVTARCANGMKYLALSSLTTASTGGRIDNMINTVLTAAGWPSSAGGWPVDATTGWRTLQTALSSGSRYPARNTPAVEICRNLADTEGGAFFVNLGGKAYFVNRHFWKDDMKTARATFGDQTALPYTDLVLGSDDYQLYNAVSVTGLKGNTQSTSDATSIALYGRRALVRTGLPVGGSTDAKKLARWLVQRYKDPGIRVSRIECKPRSDTGLWDLYDNTSGAGLGAKIHVNRHPPGGGTITAICHVEGIETNIDVNNNDWTLAFDMSPANLQPDSEVY